MLNKVSFQASDNVTIIGDYYEAESSIGHTILTLHMMPTDRSSWKAFAEQANLAGYDVLAIDFRGHGESSKKGNESLDFQKFTDEEHRESIKDIEASIEFLKTQGVSNFSLVGASIGANLALLYMTQHQEIFTGVLISPGLNYRGIDAEKLCPGLLSSQSILLVSGDKDEVSYQAVLNLVSKVSGNCDSIILPTPDHGTNLFNHHPKLIIRILSWLNDEVGL